MFRISSFLTRGVIVAAASMIATACTDGATAITAPAVAPNAAAVGASSQSYAAKASTKTLSPSTTTGTNGGGIKVGILAFSNEVNVNVTASKVIGPDGGILSLPETGFTLIVPKGAVSAPTTFQVTPVGGRYVAYDFEPHGTTFAVPLTFMQDLSKTKFKAGSTIGGGYFSDKSQVESSTGSASISELFTLSFDNFGFTFFSITHFSGYLVSMA